MSALAGGWGRGDCDAKTKDGKRKAGLISARPHANLLCKLAVKSIPGTALKRDFLAECAGSAVGRFGRGVGGWWSRQGREEKKNSHTGIALSPLARRSRTTRLLWRASIKPAPANLAPGTRPAVDLYLGERQLPEAPEKAPAVCRLQSRRFLFRAELYQRCT